MVAGPTAPPPRPSDRGASRSPAVAAVSPSGSTPRPLADTLADTLGIAAIVVIAAAGQLLHTLRDTRLPQDLGLYYQRLPALYGALGGDPAGASGIGAALLDVGGGYALTLAAAMRLLGRSPLLFDGIGIAWLIALLAAVAWCAWRAGGARAALAATALAAAFPMVFVHARTAWIHVPEAALVLAATAAWLGDPTLRRRGPRVVIALTGAAALALRPSAAVWLLPLAGAIGWRLRDVEGRWPRLAWALGPWLLGAAPLVHTIGPYLLAKLAARERYVEELPSLAGQLFVALGSLAGGLAAAAALVGLRRPRPPAWGLWLGWIVAALALVVLFRAGVDNHTLAACALAVLAGCGVARLGRGAVAVPLACAALMHAPQWVPPPDPGGGVDRALGWLGIAVQPGARNHYRTYAGGHADAILALIDASCDDDPCRIAVDQGLFQPYAEDPGALQLFLTGRDAARIVALAGPSAGSVRGEFAAAVHFECPARDAAWRERYPDSEALFREIGRRQQLRPVWSRDVEPGCRQVWLTPDGRVPFPDRLPDAQAPETPGGRPPDGLAAEHPPPGPAGPVADGAPGPTGSATDRAIAGALARALDGEATAADRDTLRSAADRWRSDGGPWNHDVVAICAGAGEPFDDAQAQVAVPHAAAPDAVVADDGRILLYVVDGDLDALLALADGGAEALRTRGLPGLGALRLLTSADGLTFEPVDDFAVEGIVRGLAVDPDVSPLPHGGWRMLYRGLPVRSWPGPPDLDAAPLDLFTAVSVDRVHWRQEGLAASAVPGSPTAHCADDDRCVLWTGGLRSGDSRNGGRQFRLQGEPVVHGHEPDLVVPRAGGLALVYRTPADELQLRPLGPDGGWIDAEGEALTALSLGHPTLVERADGSRCLYAERRRERERSEP